MRKIAVILLVVLLSAAGCKNVELDPFWIFGGERHYTGGGSTAQDKWSHSQNEQDKWRR